MSQIQANTTEQLEAAFELFNQMSDSLGESYRELEARVAELSQQLAAERSEKFRELAAKEQMANRLANLLAALPGGVIVLDGLDRITEANPEAIELLGTDILGQSWPAVIETKIKPGAKTAAGELELATGRFASLSERVLDAEGNQVVLLTDVTEAREIQEWINRETRLTALGEMSARLAHQLRTPLSSAMLYLSQLGFGDQIPSEHTELTKKISARLQHLEELIEGMLGYVRGEERSQSRFSLMELSQEFEAVILSKVEVKKGLAIVQHCSNDLQVQGDRQSILSALINIAENAIDIIDEPHLDVSVGIEGQWIDFYIRDNGPGIESGIMKSIFDPFFTTRHGGTGLGLAIADITAREHGGFIEVDNATDGGAVFHIRIQAQSTNPGVGRLPSKTPEQIQAAIHEE